MSFMSRFAALTGYAVQSGTAYGRTNGIYFNATPDEMGQVVTVRAYIRPIETLTFRDTGRGRGIDIDRVNDYLKVRQRDYANTGAEADERSLWLSLKDNPSADKVSNFLVEFSRFLSEKGYVSSCAVCPQTRNLEYRMQERELLEVCPACAEKHSDVLKNLTIESDIKSSFSRGVTGAVLGALAGVALWIIINFVSRYSFLCGLPMAYFIYKGYHLTHGKHHKNMFILLFAALILFTYIAVMSCEGINIYRARLSAGYETGLIREISSTMVGLLNPKVYDVAFLWMRLGIGLLFSGLGGFALVLRFRRENKAGMKPVPTAPKKTDSAYRR